MAISVVQSTGSNGSGTSLALAFGSGLTAGNLAFAWGAGRTNPCTSVDDTLHGVAAYTEHVASRSSNGSSAQSIRAYYRENTSAGACTVTANYAVSSDATSLAIQEISGLATSSAVDQGNNANGSSATLVSGNITTTVADEIILGAASQRQGGTSNLTIDPDYTVQIDTGYGREFMTGYRIVSATETNNYQPTSAAVDDYCASIISFKGVQPTFEQEGFRWRADDGSETTATWLAVQDVAITRASLTNTRLRVLVNATLDPASTQYQLEYKVSGGSYAKVPTSTSPGSPVFGTQGAVATGGTTSITVAFPSSIAAGDLLVLFVAVRNGSATITTPASPVFTAPSNNEASGGAGAEGADAGTSKCAVFYREADGTESGNLTVTIGNSPSTSTGILLRYTKAFPWATWSVAAAQGTDVSSGTTAWSAAMNVDPGIAIGDVLLSCIVPNTDASTWSTEDVTGTGLASALTSERTETNVTTPGNDLDIVVCEHDVTAALTSGVPTVVATTVGTTAEGSTVLFRMRLGGTPAMLMSDSANIAASGEATTAQLTAPSGKSTSDFVAGRMQDDENPADAVDITTDDYSELEWCFQATAAASDGEIYDFRVTKAGTAFDTYTVTPQWTIGTVTTTQLFAATPRFVRGRAVRKRRPS